MKYIRELREGTRISGIYLCKFRQSAVTKNGKPYDNVILQDKTGTIDGKIWEPNSVGIDEFEALDYIEVMGDVNSFAGALQISIKRARKASWRPTTKSTGSIAMPIGGCSPTCCGERWALTES